MNGPTLSVHLVTWNSAAFLPALLSSVQQQTFQPQQVIVVDNASHDESTAIVRRMMPAATLIRNTENRGFCGGHNQALAQSTARYAALVNPDIVLPPQAFARFIAVLEAHPTFGSIGGKLLKWEGTSGIVDSAGILGTRYREFLNRGEGERDQGQYDVPSEVFGLTGALVVFRRAALDDIRCDGEYLDEDLFSYKEDVDLAWRLRLRGWRNWYEPSVVAEHQRTVRHEAGLTVMARRRRKRAFINRSSYRNHLLVLWKFTRWHEWLLPRPWILMFEVAKACFLPFFEPRTLPGFLDALRCLPRILRKRRTVFARRTVPFAEVNRWFIASSPWTSPSSSSTTKRADS